MSKNKAIMFLVCVSFLMVCCVSSAQAKDSSTMTNAQLSDVLFRMLNLSLPEGSEGLSVKDLFNTQAELLAERGITAFVGNKPGEEVTRGFLCGILTAMMTEVTGEEGGTVPTRGSNSSLFDDALFGYTGAGTGKGASTSIENVCCVTCPNDEVLEFSKVIELLNIPDLSTTFAEAYSAPGQGSTGRGGPQGGIGNQVPAQNPIPEDLKDPGLNFASQIE